MIEFELPEPPSGNHRNNMTKSGHTYPSRLYKDFIQRASLILIRIGKPNYSSGVKLGIRVELWHKDNRKRDIDGAIKCLFDQIQRSWGIDDFDYWHLEVNRMGVKPKDGLMKVLIWQLPDQPSV